MSRILAFAVALTMAVYARADESLFRYHLIADGTTPVPGGPGTFSGFGQPSIDGDTLAFIGVPGAEPDRQGIYVGNANELGLVVNNDTAVPNGIANFHHYGSEVSLDGQDVAFWGQHDGPLSASVQGVYAMRDGVLDVIADGSTVYPGSASTITGFDAVDVRIAGGEVAFGANSSDDHDGLLVSDGTTPRLIAERNMPVPNESGWLFHRSYRPLAVDGDRVLFWAISHDPADTNLSEYATGIYLSEGDSLRVIADNTMPMPGTEGMFGCIGGVVGGLDGTSVVFTADSQNCNGTTSNPSPRLRGTYLWNDGVIETIVDTATVVPGSTDVFGASAIARDGDNIAFVGVAATGENPVSALYLWHDGRMDKVVDATYTFQGRAIQYFNFGQEGLSGNSLAFVVRFDDDNTGAIYVATLVPEPSSFVIAALGMLFLAMRIRRR